MQAATNANLWHQRLGNVYPETLNLLNKLDNKGVSFDGPVPHCDVYITGKCRHWTTSRRSITTSNTLSSWCSQI